MRYIDVNWLHEFVDEPYRFISEIGEDQFEVRKLEFFRSGDVGFASSTIQSKGTMLGVVAVPLLEEVNLNAEFQGISISKHEFEIE